MTTQNITGTNTAGLRPAPRRLTKQQAQVKCSGCRRLDTSECAAWADRVGWCTADGQYRAADIERACDSFSDNGGL